MALISSIISGGFAIASVVISVGITTYNQNRINKINNAMETKKKH